MVRDAVSKRTISSIGSGSAQAGWPSCRSDGVENESKSDSGPQFVAGDEWAGLELIPDPVVVVDLDLCVVEANSAAELLFGASRQSWYGRLPLELVHPDDVNLVLSSHTEIVSKARGTPIEVRVKVADGSYRLVELIGGTRATSRGVVVVLTLRDVTERRQWEVAANRPEAFRVLVETMPVIVALVDAVGCVQSVSGAFNRHLGHDPSRVLGVELSEFAVTADADRLRLQLRDATETPGTSIIETQFRCADGRGVPFELTVTNLLDDPVVNGLVVCAIDVTERARAVEALALSARRFEAVLDSSTDLVTVIDGSGTVTYANRVNERLLGHESAPRLGSSVFDMLHPDDVGRCAELFATAKMTPGPVAPFEVRAQHEDGTYRTLEVSANNLLHDPAIAGIVVTSRDVTDRRLVEASLHEAEARFTRVFESSSVGISIVDLDGRLIRVNAAYERMLGYESAEILTKTIFELSEPGTRQRTEELFRSLVAGEIDQYRIDKQLRRADGTWVWVQVSASVVRDDRGRAQYAIESISDTSEIHTLTEELERRVSHDYLTGLSARSVLPDHLERCLAQTARTGQVFAVLAIDLDGFKQVNDRMGHQGGDQVLIEVAQRLQAMVRTGDLVVRVGGDEFVIVLAPPTTEADAERIAGRVVSALGSPIRVEAGPAQIGASVGVAHSTTGLETPDSLLNQADRNAYFAKRSGGRRYELGQGLRDAEIESAAASARAPAGESGSGPSANGRGIRIESP